MRWDALLFPPAINMHFKCIFCDHFCLDDIKTLASCFVTLYRFRRIAECGMWILLNESSHVAPLMSELERKQMKRMQLQSMFLVQCNSVWMACFDARSQHLWLKHVPHHRGRDTFRMDSVYTTNALLSFAFWTIFICGFSDDLDPIYTCI